jgi:hypothetical protein
MAKPRDDEKALALWAISQVRQNGGVIEHPKTSTLWETGFCSPGVVDQFGGFIFPILQSQFGHKADKSTYLYIVGIPPVEIPDFDFSLAYATHIVGTPGRRKDGTRLKKGDYGYRPEISKAEREHTPIELACYLVALALKIQNYKNTRGTNE